VSIGDLYFAFTAEHFIFAELDEQVYILGDIGVNRLLGEDPLCKNGYFLSANVMGNILFLRYPIEPESNGNDNGFATRVKPLSPNTIIDFIKEKLSTDNEQTIIANILSNAARHSLKVYLV